MEPNKLNQIPNIYTPQLKSLVISRNECRVMLKQFKKKLLRGEFNDLMEVAIDD